MLSGFAFRKKKTCRSGLAPKTIPKKKLIYELFAIAGAVEVNQKCVFHSKCVTDLTPKPKTEIKDKKLETQI